MDTVHAPATLGDFMLMAFAGLVSTALCLGLLLNALFLLISNDKWHRLMHLVICLACFYCLLVPAE